ncbi:MAG: cytochrome c oxidase subunit 3 [Anaerolineales bacterium]
MTHATISHPHATPTWQGITTVKFAWWLFLASEVMFFAGLIAAYVVLRAGSPTWPIVSEELNVPLVATNTFILIVSSVTMVQAYAGVETGDQRKLRLMLIATAALGVIFVGIQAYEWSELLREGTTAQSDLFGATFYTLTGFHGLHVSGGVVGLFFVVAKALRGGYTQTHHEGVELMGLYWHFVDIVWILLFTILYLV